MPVSSPKILRASATAAKLTDTAPDPSAVSVRTRLPTPNDEWNSRFSTGPTVWAVLAGRVRVLDLSQNLRLADDQRIEARRHPEEVPGDVEVLAIVKVRAHHASGRCRGRR